MERATRRLKYWLMSRGHCSLERIWLERQDLFEELPPELGELPMRLVLYASEFLRLMCYSGPEVPPQGELLEKTCCFLSQLRAANWNLNFTESGNLFVPDVQMRDIPLPGLARREFDDVENLEDVDLGHNEAVALDLVTEQAGSLDSKSDSEDIYVQDSSCTNFKIF